MFEGFFRRQGRQDCHHALEIFHFPNKYFSKFLFASKIMWFLIFLCLQLSFKKWFLKYLCETYFHAKSSCERKEQGCLQKVKMVYFDKLQFCKITLYTKHFALFRKFAKLDYWLGYINDPFTNIFLVLDKIKKYYPLKITND